MQINYGVNRKQGKRIEHRNGKLDFPEFTEDVFTLDGDEYNNVHDIIKRAIQDANPGWFVTGYAPANKPLIEIERAVRANGPMIISLDDAGQMFAGVATISQAIFDVLDSDDHYAADLWEGDYGAWKVTEEEASVNRGDLVRAVIKRIAELQASPHDGVKLENLCSRHIKAILPKPTTGVCIQCEKEREHGL